MSQAAKLYWGAWADTPVSWAKQDERRIPEHWKRFGTRISPLTKSPRLAATPPNALINLLYALTEAEARIAAIAMGMDPDIGVLHVDTRSRSSLACDLQEPIRPKVDAFILNWLQAELLRKADFWEDRQGNCRVCSPLVIKLCETADTWRGLVSPFTEYVARTLGASATERARSTIPTRLTQQHRREAKGSSSFPRVEMPKPESICRVCGKDIDRDHDYCRDCAAKNSTACLISGARLGRIAAQSAQAQERRKETKRRHDLARNNWSPDDQPTWLDEEMYAQEILPALRSATLSQIASKIGVSIPCASDIRRGRRVPHPRHWIALAELAGQTTEKETH